MDFNFHQTETPRRSKINARVYITLLFAVISLAAVFFVWQNYQNKDVAQINKEDKNADQEIKDLISRVSALVALPTDEVPTIATVSDLSKLKGQAFFTKAKNGDKVLIYVKAQKAILYDPVGNKIVEIGPVKSKSP